MGRNMESHNFYCINCGRKGMVLSRNKGFKHKSFHRKKMYCFYCKRDINMVECKDEYESRKFLDNFKKGLYKKEAKESLFYCGGEK